MKLENIGVVMEEKNEDLVIATKISTEGELVPKKPLETDSFYSIPLILYYNGYRSNEE